MKQSDKLSNRKTGKITFKKNLDRNGDKIIEAGHFLDMGGGIKSIDTILDIYPEYKVVQTVCGDICLDYSIPFKEFLEVADKIKELMGDCKDAPEEKMWPQDDYYEILEDLLVIFNEAKERLEKIEEEK